MMLDEYIECYDALYFWYSTSVAEHSAMWNEYVDKINRVADSNFTVNIFVNIFYAILTLVASYYVWHGEFMYRVMWCAIASLCVVVPLEVSTLHSIYDKNKSGIENFKNYLNDRKMVTIMYARIVFFVESIPPTIILLIFMHITMITKNITPRVIRPIPTPTIDEIIMLNIAVEDVRVAPPTNTGAAA